MGQPASLTVEECKAKKAALEAALTDYCLAFSLETNLRIVGVELSTQHVKTSNTGAWISPSVKVTVEL